MNQQTQTNVRPSLIPILSKPDSQLFLLVSIFIISRLFWFYSGIRFHSIPLLWFWQFIDPYLMQNNLLQSSIYLHTQPPLFNLLIGSIVKFAPAHTAFWFSLLYHLLGLVLCLAIWKSLVNFYLPKLPALILTLLFMLSPASILYENWLLYTYPIAVLLIVALVALQEFVKKRSFFSGSVFFWCLAACVLIRTSFHFVWLLGILLVLVRMLRSETKTILKSAVIPLLLVSFSYGWSFYLFGSMPSSTWMGMSFYKIVSFGLKESERISLVNEGKLSDASRVPPYTWLSSYSPRLKNVPVTEIPVLDQRIKSTGFNNYHNLAYHGIARMYLRDALFLIYSRPDSYFQGIKSALYIYQQSSSTFAFLEPNKSKMKRLNVFYDRIFFGQLNKEQDVFWFLSIAIIGLSLYGCGKAFHLLKQKKFDVGLPVLFITANIFYFTIVTCAFEVGENQRYRFEIDTYFLALFGLFIADLKSRWGSTTEAQETRRETAVK